ncbi:MAG: MATE family efflux transporter [Saprospiraceae bacterium]|nr:MATE family efflux transporter [Saprospiraceae bacterium]
MLKKINSEILRLSIPNIISNISVPLLSTVDTILMGGLSNSHLAAVGLGSMIFNIIYWNFGFLRMGTTGITAQYYGAGSNKNIWLSFLRAAILALLLAVLLILIQSYLYAGCSWALNISGAVDPLVVQYYDIRIWAAPASLLLMVVMGWLFGMQNAIYPLILTVIINVINIFLSYYLVLYKGMDVRGVALGTVIAQYVGLAFGLALIARKYKDLIRFNLWKELKQWEAFVRFMKVNVDLFLRTVGLTFAFGFFYSQSSKLSDTVLAVNVVLMQYVNWMSYGIDGFAFACESLVGKYKGAGNSEALKIVIRQSFLWGGVVSLIYAGIYYFFGPELFLIFSTDEQLFSFAQDLLIYMAIFPIVSFASYIWDGVFVGLTATTSMRNAMILALISFVAVFYILPVDASGAHIWMAMCSFMIFRAIYQSFYYKRFGVDLK